jgi:hypothetical protein
VWSELGQRSVRESVLISDQRYSLTQKCESFTVLALNHGSGIFLRPVSVADLFQDSHRRGAGLASPSSSRATSKRQKATAEFSPPYEFLDEFSTEYAILDSADEWARPVALLKLPFRLRNLIHGSWIPEDTIPGGYTPLITCPAPDPCSNEGPWNFATDSPNFVE